MRNVLATTRDFDAWKILRAILCETKKMENYSCVSKVAKHPPLRFMSRKGFP